MHHRNNATNITDHITDRVGDSLKIWVNNQLIPAAAPIAAVDAAQMQTIGYNAYELRLRLDGPTQCPGQCFIICIKMSGKCHYRIVTVIP